jgi:hypothetical protein
VALLVDWALWIGVGLVVLGCVGAGGGSLLVLRRLDSEMKRRDQPPSDRG